MKTTILSSRLSAVMGSHLQPLHEPVIIQVVVKRGMQHRFHRKLSLCALFF